MPQPSPDGPREVEIKLAVPSAEAARALLLRAGFAETVPRSFEANLVFDTPAGDLMHGSRLLRLREFRGDGLLTFKGPPEPGPHKTRVELEMSVEDPNSMRKIIEALGYRVQFRYEKYRTTFQRASEPGHAVLDETPIGVYLELEGPPEWIDTTAAHLGFSTQDYILQSYGSLYRDWCTRAGIAPAHMVFSE